MAQACLRAKGGSVLKAEFQLFGTSACTPPSAQLGIGSLQITLDPLGAVPDVDAQLHLLSLGWS